MPDTMESARRWSGYVCPDCRFVFRVPRDHDGKGIVCPSCRRMLKIPTALDVAPPLLTLQNRCTANAIVVANDTGLLARGIRRVDILDSHNVNVLIPPFGICTSPEELVSVEE